MPRALTVFAAAGLVTAGSCNTNIPKDALPPVVCASGEYLEVVNETGQRVDVYALRGASILMLGTIGAGRSTLALPNSSASGLVFVGYREGTRQPVMQPDGGNPVNGRLEFNQRCR
jgi:hypothetical protein